MSAVRSASLILIVFAILICFVACSDSTPSNNRIDAPPFNDIDTDVDTGHTTDPVKPTQKRYSFLAAGDNIIHGDIIKDAAVRSDELNSYSFLPMYKDVADIISKADISFVNQEGPVGVESRPYAGYPNFNAPPQAGDALVDLGFDIVNIANNHMLDVREAGLLESIAYWESKDVLLLGAYKNSSDYENIRVYEHDGIKIAFLSYTYGTNGMTLNAGSKHIIPINDDEDIIRQTASAKKIADLIFVSIHWGSDYSETSWPYGRSDFEPTNEQKRLAQLIADCGADVIIGTHPHVIQRIEWLNGKNGNTTLCAYSLGNFINTMHANFNLVGGFLTFDIVKDNSGEAYIDSPLFIPTMTHYLTEESTGTRYGLQVYLLENYTQSLTAIHGSQIRPGGRFTYETLVNYVKVNIPSEFLSSYYK